MSTCTHNNVLSKHIKNINILPRKFSIFIAETVPVYGKFL